MRVRVDQDVCVSSGSCEGACPEVFRLTDEGRIEVLQPEPGEALRTAVVLAAELCPTGAIHVDG